MTSVTPSLPYGNSQTTPRSRKLFPSLVHRCSNTIHDVLRWSNDNRFRLNSLKCKQLRIDFRRESNLGTVSLKANGIAFEIVKSAKILGLTVRNDLKWNDHLNNITAKASRRIYLLKQLKRAGIDRKSLIQFYCACIRSLLEYACQAFHSSLPVY